MLEIKKMSRIICRNCFSWPRNCPVKIKEIILNNSQNNYKTGKKNKKKRKLFSQKLKNCKQIYKKNWKTKCFQIG